MSNLICDFYGIDIKMNTDKELAAKLSIHEPFLELISDEGYKDYYAPFSDSFYFNVFDDIDKSEIRAWCKEYLNEIREMWENKLPTKLPNIQKAALI